MKNKYKFIGGFTVSDNYEMKKLKKLASKGWILEDIVHGMFYKFRKDIPQTLNYSIDYNSNTDEDYFAKFHRYGWNKVLSFKDTMHIFSSKEERKAISSDLKLDRNITMQSIIKKQIELWAIVNLILIAIVAGLMYVYKLEFVPLLLVLIIPIIKLGAVIFDYYLYYEKIKVFNEYGDFKDSIANYKAYYRLNIFLAVLFLIIDLNMYGFGLRGLMMGVLFAIVSVENFRKYKKALKRYFKER